MKTFQSLVVAILCLSFSIGCERNTSKVQGLDDVAAGQRLKVDRCTGDPRVPVGSAAVALSRSLIGITNAALEAEVKSGLTAVPAEILDLFVAMGGRIRLANDVRTFCPGVTGTVDNLDGCYLYQPESLNSKRKSEVVIKADHGRVSELVVEQFGYVFVQLFGRMKFQDPSSSSFTRIATADIGIVQRQAALTKAFLLDVERSPFFGLENFVNILGKPAVAALPNLLKESGADVLTAAGVDDLRKQQIHDYIFAQAFSSYFCNAHAAVDNNVMGKLSLAEDKVDPKQVIPLLESIENSRVAMAVLFPNALNVFNRIYRDYFAGDNRSQASTCGFVEDLAGNSIAGSAEVFVKRQLSESLSSSFVKSNVVGNVEARVIQRANTQESLASVVNNLWLGSRAMKLIGALRASSATSFDPNAYMVPPRYPDKGMYSGGSAKVRASVAAAGAWLRPEGGRLRSCDR